MITQVRLHCVVVCVLNRARGGGMGFIVQVFYEWGALRLFSISFIACLFAFMRPEMVLKCG